MPKRALRLLTHSSMRRRMDAFEQLFRLLQCGHGQVARDGREACQEIHQGSPPLRYSNNAWTGTRVPRNTGTPCIVSGSFVIAFATSLSSRCWTKIVAL